MDVSSPTTFWIGKRMESGEVWGMVRNAFDFFQIFWWHRRDLLRGYFDIETLGGGSTVVTTELMFLQVFGIQMSTGPDQHLAKVWRFENRQVIQYLETFGCYQKVATCLFASAIHEAQKIRKYIYIYIYIYTCFIYIFIYVYVYIYIIYIYVYVYIYIYTYILYISIIWWFIYITK